ncbi:MAG: GNAT family N-acetyltransferase, partial [Bacteroidota bacterium]
MSISPLKLQDIPHMAQVQPHDWPDIRPHLRFYISAPNCFPVKYELGGNIAGIGTSYVHQDSAWLAHIIVAPAFRGQGIGGKIVGHILKELDKRSIDTVLLEATTLGYPVYIRHGFEPVGKYQHYLIESPISPTANQQLILRPAGGEDFEKMLALDIKATGEIRHPTLSSYLA